MFRDCLDKMGKKESEARMGSRDLRASLAKMVSMDNVDLRATVDSRDRLAGTATSDALDHPGLLDRPVPW